jgi:hypothetical protein
MTYGGIENERHTVEHHDVAKTKEMDRLLERLKGVVDSGVAMQTRDAIVKLGVTSTVVNRLMDLVVIETWSRARGYMIEILGVSGDARCVDTISEVLLGETDPWVRETAILALGRLRDPKAIVALEYLLSRSDSLHRDEVELIEGTIHKLKFAAGRILNTSVPEEQENDVVLDTPPASTDVAPVMTAPPLVLFSFAVPEDAEEEQHKVVRITVSNVGEGDAKDLRVSIEGRWEAETATVSTLSAHVPQHLNVQVLPQGHGDLKLTLVLTYTDDDGREYRHAHEAVVPVRPKEVTPSSVTSVRVDQRQIQAGEESILNRPNVGTSGPD